MKRYKQLTSEQRYTIQSGINSGMTQSAIAKLIGVHQSTVSREIKRNSTEKRKTYNKEHAQMLATERKLWTHNERAKSKRLREKVLHYLCNEQWSPEQISGYLLNDQKETVAFQTIYNWIHEDKKQGGTLYLNCRHKLKKRKRGLNHASAKHIPNRTSIHLRPPEADGTRFGDFEMDTIIGKGQRSVILTIVERATGYIFIRKLNHGKNPEMLAETVWNTLLPWKNKLRSITTDNGFEFIKHQIISKRLNVPVYFADPYASWQKGAIEYANKLIRQYIPKNIDFRDITDQTINLIQNKLNSRPRKKLDYENPRSLFSKLL